MNELLKKIKSIIPSVNEEVYNNIDLNSLITYSAHILENESIPLTFENIYVVCFLSFPKRFCLIGFEDFPDGARINRAILQCLPKYQNLLIGKAKKGYKLTSFGKSRALEVERKLKLKYSQNKISEEKISKRTIDYSEKIEEFSKKPAFKKFLENKKESIGVDDIFDFFDASPYSGKKMINEKLSRYEGIAKYSKSKELIDFIKWVKNKEEFKEYLR